MIVAGRDDLVADEIEARSGDAERAQG